MKKETVIISLGGSLIVPDEINVDFLKKFRKLILKGVEEEKKFVIICGGGETARRYQNAAGEITKLTRDDLDWLGIHGTRINAHLIRTIFREKAEPEIVDDPTKNFNMEKPILVTAGWKPGWSTDYVSVMIAKELGINKMVNLTNIKYVYDKDPNKYKDAEPIKKISWEKFREIVGDEWDPGLNLPFDPVASREAEKLGMEVFLLKGSNLENLESFLNNEEYEGTKIG